MSAVARHTTLATLGLVAVTAIWGSTFYMIHDLVSRLPAADFLAVRFLIAATVMAVLFHRPLLRLGWRQWRQGMILGVIYGVGQLLQTVGLAHTQASISGFATSMYVVFTPLLATVLFGQRLPSSTWIAVVCSTGGVAVLALRGLSLSYGVWLTLASAACYGLHIVYLGRWARPGNAFALSTVQMLVIALVCLLATLPQGPRLPADAAAWAAVVYMALAAGAGAMLIQTWAQGHMPAERAAIVMTLEPVFAALFAIVLGGESMTWRLVVGGILVLAAMYVVELSPRRADSPLESGHHQV